MTTDIDWAALPARYKAEADAAWTGIVERSRYGSGRRQEPIQTGAGVALLIHEATYGAVDAQLVLAGLVPPVSVVLTEDGRGVVLDWHDGPSDIDGWVYYERWETGVRVAHGYVDPTTRRIVQSG